MQFLGEQQEVIDLTSDEDEVAVVDAAMKTGRRTVDGITSMSDYEFTLNSSMVLFGSTLLSHLIS